MSISSVGANNTLGVARQVDLPGGLRLLEPSRIALLEMDRRSGLGKRFADTPQKVRTTQKMPNSLTLLVVALAPHP